MSKTEDVNLVLTNIEINKKSVIKFKIENLSNANYFLPLSSLTFENNFDDKDLYNCIFLQPVFTDKTGTIISTNNSKVIVKSFDISKSRDSLFSKKMQLYNKHFKNFILLRQLVKISKSKSVFFEQDIINYDELSLLSISKKRYDFKPGNKYFIHFEYQLDKEYYYSKVNEKSRYKLEKIGYKPYFGKLISNKALFVFNTEVEK